jgi:hypothetical protein
VPALGQEGITGSVWFSRPRTAISSGRGVLVVFSAGLSISSLPVCLIGDPPEMEGAMKIMLQVGVFTAT